MYKYLVAFTLITPLIGIYLVEQGQHAGSVGVDGSRNGATVAFLLYVAVVCAIAFLASRIPRLTIATLPSTKARRASVQLDEITSAARFHQFSVKFFWLNLFFLLVMLFGFGGYKVWLGIIGKGTFRATLGPFGALAFTMTKVTIPALFAYSTILYGRAQNGKRDAFLWWVNAGLILFTGATWGYKTSSLFMLLPAILIFNWRVTMGALLRLTLFASAVPFVLFFVFDSTSVGNVGAWEFILTRLTVLQGDVAWYVWGLHKEAEVFPSYLPTLSAALGDTFLRMTGVSRDNWEQWMTYHYDWVMSYVANVPLEAISGGHSITATPFAEGIIAGGVGGMLMFAGIAGVLIGRTYFHIQRSMNEARDVRTAILATYFCFFIFPWLNSGSITQLFHMSVFVNFTFTFALMRVLAAYTSPHGRRHAPESHPREPLQAVSASRDGIIPSWSGAT